MSITAELLQSVTDKVAEIPEIKYTSEDWGQLNDYDPAPVKYPCVLIDEQSSVFSDIGRDKTQTPQNRQQGTAQVIITVANQRLSNSSHKAPQSQKNKAWEIHSLIELVHQKLQGWSPVQEQGKLMRISRRKINRNDGIQQYQIVYTIGLSNV